jgi:hypothetical protein
VVCFLIWHRKTMMDMLRRIAVQSDDRVGQGQATVKNRVLVGSVPGKARPGTDHQNNASSCSDNCYDILDHEEYRC